MFAPEDAGVKDAWPSGAKVFAPTAARFPLDLLPNSRHVTVFDVGDTASCVFDPPDPLLFHGNTPLKQINNYI